jgi:hypothetical protein
MADRRQVGQTHAGPQAGCGLYGISDSRESLTVLGNVVHVEEELGSGLEQRCSVEGGHPRTDWAEAVEPSKQLRDE